MNNEAPRWSLMTNPAIQVPVILRVAIYWVSCQALIAITIIGFQFLAGSPSGEGSSESQLLVPALIVSAVALPIALVDMLGLTNRYLGSVSRLETKMKKLAQEVDTARLDYPTDDPCREIYSSLNQLLAQLHARQADAPSSCQSHSEQTPVA